MSHGKPCGDNAPAQVLPPARFKLRYKIESCEHLVHIFMCSSISGGGAARDGSGVKLTVSGARPTENNFRLDGVSLNDNSNTTPGSILGTNMGVEAVREFSVVSNITPPSMDAQPAESLMR